MLSEGVSAGGWNSWSFISRLHSFHRISTASGRCRQHKHHRIPMPIPYHPSRQRSRMNIPCLRPRLHGGQYRVQLPSRMIGEPAVYRECVPYLAPGASCPMQTYTRGEPPRPQRCMSPLQGATLIICPPHRPESSNGTSPRRKIKGH